MLGMIRKARSRAAFMAGRAAGLEQKVSTRQSHFYKLGYSLGKAGGNNARAMFEKEWEAFEGSDATEQETEFDVQEFEDPGDMDEFVDEADEDEADEDDEDDDEPDREDAGDMDDGGEDDHFDEIVDEVVDDADGDDDEDADDDFFDEADYEE